MEGGNQNNQNQNNMYNYPYAYDQYGYYYPQNYNTSAPVPQGDPSAALSSMVYQLQHQTHQRQALGAMAAASITSTLGQRTQNVDYYTDYYPQDLRSVINYKDLSQQTTPTADTPAKEPVEDPLAKKPKFCCNRWLKSAIAVAQHEKLHIQCPSCDHMCLKSALQEHEENFHGKEKIETNKKPSRPDGMIPPNAPRIETPEELEAWILARKRNWPTKDNVERKEKEEAEKEARGELPNKKRKPNCKKDQQLAKRQKIEEKKNSLVAQYDSDSDSDSDIMDLEKDAISSKDPSVMGKILLPEDRPKRRCRYFAMGKCSKGDECGFSHEKPEPKPKQPRAAPTFKKRPNLLFKLLEKEILQEKSVILQCLRYIVDNKHFGKGTDASSKQEENPIGKAIKDNIEKVDVKTLEVETLASVDANSPLIKDVTKVLDSTCEGESSLSLDLEQANQSEYQENNDASLESTHNIDTLSTL